MDDNEQAHRIRRVEDICKHSDAEREYVTVVGHDELKHALERGYKITKLYNAMYWPETNENGDPNFSQDMFKGFLKKTYTQIFRFF